MVDDGSLLSTSDLLNFNNTVTQGSTANIIGQGLGAFNPNMSSWDPATQGIASFGKSFLQGFLQNQARAESASQLNKVISVLQQLRSDPNNVVFPEGVDADAAAVLRGTAILKRDAFDQNQNLAIRDLLQKVQVAGLSKKAEILGENEAFETMGAGGATENPNSPGYKINQDRLSSERSLANDFLTQTQRFKLKEEGLSALTEAYKDMSGTSDYELIRRAAQSVEPGLAVRADDIQSLEGAASALGMTTQAVKNALMGTTKLTPEVRAGIMRTAKRSYDASLGDFNTLRDSFLSRSQQGNLNSANVVPWGAAKSFDELYPNTDISLGMSQPMSEIDAALARKGYNPDGSKMSKPEPTPLNGRQILR